MPPISAFNLTFFSEAYTFRNSLKPNLFSTFCDLGNYSILKLYSLRETPVLTQPPVQLLAVIIIVSVQHKKRPPSMSTAL